MQKSQHVQYRFYAVFLASFFNAVSQSAPFDQLWRGIIGRKALRRNRRCCWTCLKGLWAAVQPHLGHQGDQYYNRTLPPLLRGSGFVTAGGPLSDPSGSSSSTPFPVPNTPHANKICPRSNLDQESEDGGKRSEMRTNACSTPNSEGHLKAAHSLIQSCIPADQRLQRLRWGPAGGSVWGGGGRGGFWCIFGVTNCTQCRLSPRHPTCSFLHPARLAALLQGFALRNATLWDFSTHDASLPGVRFTQRQFGHREY